MLLRELVDAHAAVRATAARNAKVARLAELLARVEPAETPAAVAWLSGELTQRQIGVGWAALKALPAAAAEPALTVAEVEDELTRVGGLRGPGSQAARREALAALFGRATEAEQRFLVALLLGDLGQGALAGVMTEAVAKAAGVPRDVLRRALMLRGDLGAVAAIAFAEGAAGLEAVGLELLRPVQPMLAGTAADVDAALERIAPAAVDFKLDGVRVQVHRRGSEVRVFTRTLDDVTARLPEVVEAALALPAEAVVLDGEAIALRPDGRPEPFQVTASRLGAKRDGPLTVLFFDVLHAGGEDLIDRPGSERFAALAALVPEAARVPRRVVEDADGARAVLAAALAAGHEGVIVKALDAPYAAGRRGAGWLKVKPRHTLDLVVLAAEWGHGRRRGWLSNLHLGARVRRRAGDARQDVQGPHRRDARVADRAAARARGRPRGARGARAAGAGGRDRVRRRPDQPALPGRRRAALRARAAPPPGQACVRGRHARERAGHPRGLVRRLDDDRADHPQRDGEREADDAEHEAGGRLPHVRHAVAPDLLLAERGERDREDAEEHAEDREEGGRDRDDPEDQRGQRLAGLASTLQPGRAGHIRCPLPRAGVQWSRASVQPRCSPPGSFDLPDTSLPGAPEIHSCDPGTSRILPRGRRRSPLDRSGGRSMDMWARRRFAVVTLGAGLAALASAGSAGAAQFVYSSNVAAGTVSMFDAATGGSAGPDIPVGGSPQGLAVSPDGSEIYVTNIATNSVSVIDAATRSVVATVPVGSLPVEVAPTPDGDRVLVTNFGSNSVSVIDTATRAVVSTVVVGNSPYGIAVAPDGERAYAVNQASNTVTVIDTETATVVDTFAVGNAPLFAALNPEGTRLFVVASQSGGLWALDPGIGAVTGTVGPATGVDVAVTRDGGTVYWSSTNVIQDDTTPPPPDATPPVSPPAPCQRAIVLTDVARHAGRVRVAGVARIRYGGQPVTLLRGKRILGHATVAQDGSFRTTLRLAGRRARVHAVVAGHQSRALRVTRQLRITGRRTLPDGRLRVTGRVPGGRGAVQVRVQTGCVPGRTRTVRSVRADRRGRVAVTLPTPSAADGVAVYRLATRRPPSFSLPVLMTR